MALPDLDTRSVRDVVEENFDKIGLRTFGTRMIYIGEHTLPRQDLISIFQKTTDVVNACYCDIHVRGLLLVYDSYFLHILEGSEDTTNRHLRFLFQREEKWIKEMEDKDKDAAEEDVGLSVIMTEEPEMKVERKIFKRLKLVMIYDCIKKLAFRGWRSITARPPSLIGKLDVYWPMQEHMEQLRICLNKINKLCALADADENLSFEGVSAADPKMLALPEVALMDFLLQSPYILDLRETANMYRRVDDHSLYFEEVWPVPTHFTPRLLYKLKIDDSFVEPLPVMPWENVKKDDDDEQKGSQSSYQGDGSSSSSD